MDVRGPREPAISRLSLFYHFFASLCHFLPLLMELFVEPNEHGKKP
jgi:hypothetical protein